MPTQHLKSTKHDYTLTKLLAAGDIADIWLGTADTREYTIKISRFDTANKLLENEKTNLTTLLKAATAAGKDKKPTTYVKYLPLFAESFIINDGFRKQVNAFGFDTKYDHRLFTLEQVKQQYPTGLNGRHLGWVFKRLLTILGFVHSQKIVHGAVMPAHVMIQPDTHGLKLVGWGHSVKDGEIITSTSMKYKNWCPPEILTKSKAGATTDIYLAAKCMIYLIGGNSTNGSIPKTIPNELQLFLKSCLIESPKMRPDNSWSLLEEFDDVLYKLYGKPKFEILTLT